MRKRFEWQGGIAQEDRMIKDKYRTFVKTLQYSYQGADVQLVQKYTECATVENQTYRALINPNKLKQDYDDKVLSIDYAAGYESGDIIKWEGTNSHWLIYLQELTEDAYFRSGIRRCRYQIKFKTEDGKICSTWAAIRGPVETAIDTIQKNQIRVDRPNWSLSILLPLNNQTKQFFDRYSEFLFAEKCWRVEAIDTISIPNVMEVIAQEYYIDKDTDDITNELKDGLVIEPVVEENAAISGNTFIKPNIPELYSMNRAGGAWKVLENYPVCIEIIDGSTIQLTWQKMTSGQFTLQWTDGTIVEEKIIVVESLF